MRKIVLWINSKNGEETKFTRNYLNFKVCGHEICRVHKDSKISVAGQYAESLELLDLGQRLRQGLRKYAKRIKQDDEDTKGLLQWIQSFTNLAKLKLNCCNFPEGFNIQVSEKLKVLISTENELEVIIFLVLYFLVFNQFLS